MARKRRKDVVDNFSEEKAEFGSSNRRKERLSGEERLTDSEVILDLLVRRFQIILLILIRAIVL